MEQRHAARDAGGAEGFARLEARQQTSASQTRPVFSARAAIWRNTEALVLAGSAGSIDPGSINSGIIASRGRNRRVSFEVCR